MTDRMALLQMLQERAKRQFPVPHPPCDCRLQTLIAELEHYIAACRRRGKARALVLSAEHVYPAVADELQAIIAKYIKSEN